MPRGYLPRDPLFDTIRPWSPLGIPRQAPDVLDRANLNTSTGVLLLSAALKCNSPPSSCNTKVTRSGGPLLPPQASRIPQSKPLSNLCPATLPRDETSFPRPRQKEKEKKILRPVHQPTTRQRERSRTMEAQWKGGRQLAPGDHLCTCTEPLLRTIPSPLRPLSCICDVGLPNARPISARVLSLFVIVRSTLRRTFHKGKCTARHWTIHSSVSCRRYPAGSSAGCVIFAPRWGNLFSITSLSKLPFAG